MISLRKILFPCTSYLISKYDIDPYDAPIKEKIKLTISFMIDILLWIIALLILIILLPIILIIAIIAIVIIVIIFIILLVIFIILLILFFVYIIVCCFAQLLYNILTCNCVHLHVPPV
jgi:hypothetical protein